MAHWQLVNCGACKRCLSGGGGVHGPYLFWHERKGGKEREHKYGGKGTSDATSISLKDPGPPDGYAGAQLDRAREEERERIRARADADYERRERAMTSEQREKRQVVLGLLSRLSVVQRRQRRETDRRVREAEQEHAETPRGGGSSSSSSSSSSGAAPPGLLSRAAAHVRAEVAQQFAQEVADLKKQIAQQKKELAQMLKAS